MASTAAPKPPARKKLVLSAREQDMLRGILDDKTYAQIGNDLGLGYETVKCYVARIRTKLGIRTKAKLAVWASKHLAKG